MTPFLDIIVDIYHTYIYYNILPPLNISKIYKLHHMNTYYEYNY